MLLSKNLVHKYRSKISEKLSSSSTFASIVAINMLALELYFTPICCFSKDISGDSLSTCVPMSLIYNGPKILCHSADI